MWRRLFHSVLAVMVLVSVAMPALAWATNLPNYDTLAAYLQAAPNGINLSAAQTYPGAKGDKVKIIDIEYGWDTNHIDLSKARYALEAHGTPTDPTDDTNHGTAVIGMLVADDDGKGITGIVPNAELELINVYSPEYGYDVAGALRQAASQTEPGDVVLIEQQAWDQVNGSYKYLPIEWIPEVYDAIRALTDKGIIVVEPAGNGGFDLDSVSPGQTFPLGKPDSGAIMVGAGQACAGQPHIASRLGLSSYGKRVDLQGPGNCGISTGYGDLYGLTGPDQYYTQSFNGTSAAAAVVAGAAAALSSAYQTLNGGNALKPQAMRALLQQTGTSQDTMSGTLSGNIGQLPDVAKAIAVSKSSASTATLTTVTAAAASTKSVQVNLDARHRAVLTWKAPRNLKVQKYKVYRDNVLIGIISGTRFTDSSIKNNRQYTYKIEAINTSGKVVAAGNNRLQIP